MTDLKEKRERREFLSEKNLEQMRNEEERAQYHTNVKKHNRYLTVSYGTIENKQNFAPLFF